MPDHKFGLVACARWEEADALEWLDYHRSIGVSHIYLYCNDDTPDILHSVIESHVIGEHPFVTFHHWHPSRGAQAHMYSHFLATHRHETEWICFLDIDEFLVIKQHNDISLFMAPLEKCYDAVYLNWLVYGAGGRIKRQDGSVLAGLTRRNGKLDYHTKNFIRSRCAVPHLIWPKVGPGVLPFWHFWDDYGLEGLRICDALGDPIERYTENWPSRANSLITRPGFQERALETAYVAHYQFKSEEDFMRRVARGGNPSQQSWKKVYEEGRYRTILDANEAVADNYLRDYWISLNKAGDIEPATS